MICLQLYQVEMNLAIAYIVVTFPVHLNPSLAIFYKEAPTSLA